MRFLIDARLPPRLARWLASKGHQASHVSDFGLAAADDTAIWARAVALDGVLLTKDEDFVAIRERASSGPAVVWLRIGNATNRVLVDWLKPRFAALLAALEAGETVSEVR